MVIDRFLPRRELFLRRLAIVDEGLKRIFMPAKWRLQGIIDRGHVYWRCSGWAMHGHRAPPLLTLNVMLHLWSAWLIRRSRANSRVSDDLRTKTESFVRSTTNGYCRLLLHSRSAYCIYRCSLST